MWTSEKLAKFVAISIRWPMLINDLYAEKNLLHDLQFIALDSSQIEIEADNLKLVFWSKQQELMDFLKVGFYNPDDNSIDYEKLKIYALSDLNYDKLIDISPINTLPIVHLGNNDGGISRYDEHIINSKLNTNTDMENALEHVHVNLRNFKLWFLDILDIDLYFKDGTEIQYEPSENYNFSTALEEHVSPEEDPHMYEALKKEVHDFKSMIASLLEEEGYGKIDLNSIDYEVVEFIEPND
ncbi:hypothetical protein [uncultured Methanolobus sp.]|uniref:hypothetical protein n=1 Tax=uncultured Methanolobus sp. TaxID=218300 RepID=UPI002AAC14BC|nr:hypothetical protein [uncultured Methanolobus sp.]